MKTIIQDGSKTWLKKGFLSLILSWSAVIGVLAAWDYWQTYIQAVNEARSSASESFRKDLVYRRWAAMHGGVYAPITQETPPNPYLSDIPERDISTPSGKKLTLINPAYMTRQVHELGSADQGLKGHITSLKPIRPENAPDDWEKRALQAFDRGEKEVSSLEQLGGETFFRFMRPLTTEAGCLKCHAKQDYKVGDVRGGISVSIPWAPYREALQTQLLVHVVGYGVIWLIGMFGLRVGSARLEQYLSGIKQAEKVLRESENRMSAVFHGSPIGISIIRITDGTFVDVNDAALRMLAYQRDEMIGRTSMDLQSFVHPTQLKEGMQRLREHGSLDQFQIEYRRKTGEVGVMDYSGRIVEVQGEQCILGMWVDVTEHKRAEAALNISEERLRLAMDATQQGWFDLNIQTGEVLASPTLARIAGGDPANFPMTRQLWIESIHREDRDAVLQVFQKCLQTGETQHMEYRMITRTGEWKWIHSAAKVVASDATGLPLRMTGTHADITQRKRGEHALRESESRFRRLVEQAGDGFELLDEHGQFLDVNNASCAQLGYSREELLQLTVFDTVAELSRERYESNFQSLMNQPPKTIEAVHRRKGGTIFSVEVTMSIVRFGEQPQLLTLVRDTTERRRLEEVHLQAQRLESLGTLSGGIAHDFNNILAAIRGNVDLAAGDVGPGHVAAESLEEIRKASNRASELIRRIMAFGRPEEAQQEVVDLGAVLSEVLLLLRATVPAGISFEKVLAKNTPHVLADSGQIHEALVNLTTNAAHAIGPKAGSIEYRLAPAQVDETLARSIHGLIPGLYACMTVTDNGSGMDKATIERIFDAFYTTKPVGEGTGLGLSMVHGTMRSHGGAVTAESIPGKGSSFHLYFPAAVEQAVKEDESAPAQIRPLPGQRVLYLDDEGALVFLAKRMLSRLGHQVDSYTDADEALAAFRARPQDYDIVVTDLSMPRMSGFEFASEVLGVRPGMPVLMMTGHVRADDERNAHAIGIREVILKPITMDELARVLDKLLRTSQ